jgi:hypothetical protein
VTPVFVATDFDGVSHGCFSFFPSLVDINPNGRSYASGAEDGYVRLHIFDKSYLEMKDHVPEENEVEEEDDDAGDEEEEKVADE